ncbi:helix-turn-helix transcriptional regulator [Saccharothrix sp. ST-888]|uniref:helix-turn-helix transcriptional regulator n=1 Tax=Saccharothrix sp. ST-888 TaxID=1427391 RepID=UPI0005ED25D5|nr:helix-turn-helix domain-containing protein [Saccharothrix sp. ST-888]
MTKSDTRDYERVLDLVVAVLETDEPETLWNLLAEHLLDVFGSRTVSITEMHRTHRRARTEGWAPQRIGPAISEHVERQIRQQHPLIGYLSAGEVRPVSVAGICSGWRGSACYDEAYQAFGTTHQLGLPLATARHTIRTIVLSRRGTDFGARRLAMADRIQPLLVGADRQQHRLRQLRDAAAAAGAGDTVQRAAGYGLTPRELTVLSLLTEGLTAAAIARRLAISPHTVNRHLEGIYRKLDTDNKVSAVRMAHRLGLAH